VSLKWVVIHISKKNWSTGKPRANPLRDPRIEIVLQKPNFKRAHAYGNSQPYAVPSVLVLHIEELGTAEWDSRKTSREACQLMGNTWKGGALKFTWQWPRGSYWLSADTTSVLSRKSRRGVNWLLHLFYTQKRERWVQTILSQIFKKSSTLVTLSSSW